jgi:filamentous hemagglutinin family protein
MLVSTKRILVIINLLVVSLTLKAEIITDGTLGTATSLEGPNFFINDSLGLQIGGNLFHSFQDFNIFNGETATFTSPDSVNNILARVTGNNGSIINGKLNSNANLFLINPNGLLFGRNASLNVNGSFHATTADYIGLGKTGRFAATNPNDSKLTIASPSAFGFLDTNISPITIQGNYLKVPDEQTLSIIGGDLEIYDSVLLARGGKINLIAVASKGEVVLDEFSTNFDKLGNITLSESNPAFLKSFDVANVDVTSSKGNGQIFIRAGKFLSDTGYIFADTKGDNSSKIDIFIDGDMNLSNGARITADNEGSNQGGYINFRVTNTLRLENFSTIATNNFSNGTGGTIKIEAAVLEINPGLIQAATAGNGDAGSIIIKAQEINLQNGGFINTSTVSSGKGGFINITANNLTLLNQSSISTGSYEQSSGKAGDISLQAQNIALNNASQIQTASLGERNAGAINIKSETLSLNNECLIASLAAQAGGGNIKLSINNKINIVNDSWITAETFGTKPQDNGGNLTIENPKFFILNNSLLHTKAYAGNGGNIRIIADLFIKSSDSLIDASSELGVDGEINIHSPDENFKEPILLPVNKLKLQEFSLDRCGLSKEELGKFIVTSRDSLPQAFDNDLKIHYYIP